MSDEQVLDMPIDRFWLLHRNVDRIAAEEDNRALQVALYAQSTGEGAAEFMGRLRDRMGEIVGYEDTGEELTKPPNAVRDQAGFNALKAMGRNA